MRPVPSAIVGQPSAGAATGDGCGSSRSGLVCAGPTEQAVTTTPMIKARTLWV